MAIKRCLKIIVTLIFINVILTGCPNECVHNAYTFEIGMGAYPESDSLNLGDTLWIESNYSVVLKDLASEQLIDFSNASNLGTTIRVSELLYNSDTLVDAVKNFDYLSVKGQIYSVSHLKPNRLKQLKYVEENKYFVLKFGIICKKRGIYNLALSDAVNISREKGKPCEKAAFIIPFTNKDNNLHYLSELYYKGNPVAEIDKTHTYSFKVK